MRLRLAAVRRSLSIRIADSLDLAHSARRSSRLPSRSPRRVSRKATRAHTCTRHTHRTLNLSHVPPRFALYSNENSVRLYGFVTSGALRFSRFSVKSRRFGARRYVGRARTEHHLLDTHSALQGNPRYVFVCRTRATGFPPSRSERQVNGVCAHSCDAPDDCVGERHSTAMARLDQSQRAPSPSSFRRRAGTVTPSCSVRFSR